MRYRRNNLFLPLVILSATRHIHEPITHLIYKAKNVTNDVRRAGPVVASTPKVDATAGLFVASTTASLGEAEPTQVQLPETSGGGMKTEAIDPLPPYSIHNTPDICVSQAAPLPEQTSVATQSAALYDPVSSGHPESGWNTTHAYGHQCLPNETAEDYVSAGDDGRIESSNVESTVTYRTKNPFIRVAEMTKEHLVDSLSRLLLPLFDYESLAEIIQLIVQGESLSRPADEATLSHLSIMANFLHAIFCAGWYVPWKGKPRPKMSIREARRVSARPFSIRIPNHSQEYNRLQKKLQSLYWLSGRMDSFSSLILPSDWLELLLDNEFQPVGQSILRAILRFVYTTTLCVLRFPGNFLLICLCLIYFAISGTCIAIKSSVLDIWDTSRWQYHAAVSFPQACMSILCSLKYSCVFPTPCSRRNDSALIPKSDASSSKASYTIHRPISPELPIAFPNGNGLALLEIEAEPSSLSPIAQSTCLEENSALVTATVETTSVSSGEIEELERPATPSRQPCRPCIVVADAERCIQSCETLKIAYSRSDVDLSFYDDFIDYYRAVVDKFTDHVCLIDSHPQPSGPDDNVELLTQMGEIGGDGQRMTELLERYCDSSSLAFYEDDSLHLLGRLVESASMESMSSTSTSSTESSLIAGDGPDLEKTPAKDITLADIASLAKVVEELHHSYMTDWS